MHDTTVRSTNGPTMPTMMGVHRNIYTHNIYIPIKVLKELRAFEGKSLLN